MRNNAWKNIIWKALILTGLIASTSCKEKSYDYEYRIVNDQTCNVILKFTVDKNNVAYEDTLAPATDTLIYLREDVTGDGIWDIETALQVYPFKSIEAYRMTEPIDTSKNLKLRKMWEGVFEITKYGEERGVYSLHLVDSVFVKTVYVPSDNQNQEGENNQGENNQEWNPEENNQGENNQEWNPEENNQGENNQEWNPEENNQGENNQEWNPEENNQGENNQEWNPEG